MKLGAVFILFSPDCEVINKIKKYIHNFHDIDFCIVDNSLTKNESLCETLPQHYISNENVGGIAGGLNKGVARLIDRKCDFIFTFDQDSELSEDFFSSMQAFIIDRNAKIVCPNFFDINSKTYATFVELTRWRYSVKPKPRSTAFAISSGMGFSSDIWNEIGPLKEEYIIDHVDTHFCLMAHKKNIKIEVNYDVCLDHAIGNRVVKRLMGVTFKPNNHNKIRKYYIVRNGTRLAIDYIFQYPSYFYLNVLRVGHEFACVILYEDDKKEKLKYMMKGLLHAVINKLGVAK